MGRIPVIVAIDVEPDKPFCHPATPLPWEGYQRAVAFFERFRAELESMTSFPVHLSWFYRMDPQVEMIHQDPGWPIRNYPAEFEKLVAASDEFGLHTHPFRWRPEDGDWIQDYGNQQWVEHSLQLAFTTFRREIGRPCISFRFGDRWMNNKTFHLLEDMGVQYDLTLEPGSKRMRSYHPGLPYSGYIPSQVSVPRAVYRPSKANYQKPDLSRKTGPCIIPISTAPIHLGTNTVYTRPSLPKRVMYRFTAPERVRNWTHALNIAARPEVVRSILDYNLRTLEIPYLAMVARTHIFNSPEFVDNARTNLLALRDFCVDRGSRSFIFTTPAEAVSMITGTQIDSHPRLCA